MLIVIDEKEKGQQNHWPFKKQNQSTYYSLDVLADYPFLK